MSSPRIPLVYGAAAFTTNETWSVGRIKDLKVAQDLVDLLNKLGCSEFDTSNIYGFGTSEEMIAKLDLHSGIVDTKIAPQPGGHAPAKLREAVLKSVETLKPHKVRIMYLHMPDHATPYEDTCEEINKLHKEGHFQEWGLSNYWSWEVAQIVTVCKERGYVLPTVYQGPYNFAARTNEVELFPVLRKFGLRFYAYSPLAGGLWKGDPSRPGGRHDKNDYFGKMYAKRYTSLEREQQGQVLIKEIGAKHNLTMGEIAFRWLEHHSQLGPEDRIVFGASNNAQAKENIEEALKGPLPEEVVKAIDEYWNDIKGPQPYANV